MKRPPNAMQQTITLQRERTAHVAIARGSWVGRLRETNQDASAVDAEHEILVVSDGMGAGTAGEVAARMVVSRLPDLVAYHLRSVEDHGNVAGSAIPRALEDAAMELNHAVRKKVSAMPGVDKAGATMVAALVGPGALWVAHMGDSRAYLWHQDTVAQLTRDHTVVNLLVQRGVFDEEDETALLEHRGKLTRYVGIGGGARAEITRATMAPGDRLVLCTDGLTSVLPDARISRLLRHPGGPVDACRALLEAAREEGALDNVTALVAERR